MEGFIRILIFISIYLGFFTMAFYFLGFLNKKSSKKEKIVLPKVSIIIPAYNEEKTLDKTIESVMNLDYPKEKLEVLIIDDGSKDKTFQIAKSMEKIYMNVKAFTKNNGGKGSALNYGIKKSKGEIIIGLDADSIVNQDALIKMIPYFNDPQVMCVTPAMKVYKPKGILQRIQSIEYDLGIFLRKAFTKINAVHVTPGPFSAYRRIFFEKHGGYDEKNITEDMEIAMRIQSLNYKIENSPTSLVYTVSPNKLKALTRQRRRWYFGMIKNLWAYRKMFSKEYGELGILVLPLAVFSTLYMMTISFYYAGRIIRDSINQINLYSSIGFDFMNNINLSYYVFVINFYKAISESIVLFSLFFFAFTLVLIYATNKKTKSGEGSISIFISYIFFIMFYSLLFSVWWLISIVYAITKNEINW